MQPPIDLNTKLFLREYIELAARLELEVADLYEFFSGVFSQDPERSHFWRLSAEAERYHAATIHVHLVVLEEQRDLQHPELPVAIDDMKKLIGQVTLLRKRFGEQAPTLRQALEAAIMVEESGSETHGRSQFEFLYPGLRDLFVRMADEDLAHRQTFSVALQKLAS